MREHRHQLRLLHGTRSLRLGLATGLRQGGDANSRSSPTQVPNVSDVVALAAGEHFSLFVKRDGTLWSVGRNSNGQLGLGDTNDRSTPTQVPNVGDVAAVAAGAEHSFLLKRDGTLWTIGYNKYHQLGLGDTNNRNVPTQVPNLRDVAAVAAGGYFSLSSSAATPKTSPLPP